MKITLSIDPDMKWFAVRAKVIPGCDEYRYLSFDDDRKLSWHKEENTDSYYSSLDVAMDDIMITRSIALYDYEIVSVPEIKREKKYRVRFQPVILKERVVDVTATDEDEAEEKAFAFLDWGGTYMWQNDDIEWKVQSVEEK